MNDAVGARGAALTSLALGPGAGQKEIRLAYRRFAMRYHPDVTGDPGSSKRFTRVVKAYKTLAANEARRPAGTRYRSVEDAGTDLFSLGQVLASDPDSGARGAAARALGLSGRAAAYVFLRRALYDPAPEVALDAVRAAATLGSRQAEGEIAALYSRVDPAFKAGILELAIATGERMFRSTLAAAAKDSDPRLRALAMSAARTAPG